MESQRWKRIKLNVYESIEYIFLSLFENQAYDRVTRKPIGMIYLNWINFRPLFDISKRAKYIYVCVYSLSRAIEKIVCASSQTSIEHSNMSILDLFHVTTKTIWVYIRTCMSDLRHRCFTTQGRTLKTIIPLQNGIVNSTMVLWIVYRTLPFGAVIVYTCAWNSLMSKPLFNIIYVLIDIKFIIVFETPVMECW